MPRAPRIGLLLSLLSLLQPALLVGCGAKTPEATMAALRESACAADVPGFFSRVDKARVTSTVGGLELPSAPTGSEGGADATHPSTSLNRVLGARVLEYMRPEIAQALFLGWEKDVKLGPEGKLCHMEVLETRTTESSATVSWKLAGERARVFELERGADKKWIVVGLK